MEDNTLWPPHEKQLEFINGNPLATIRLGEAGSQGGKTAIATRAFADTLNRYRNEIFIIVARYYKTLYQATLPKLEEALRARHNQWIVSSNLMKGELRDRNGNKIFLRSSKEPDALRGITAREGLFDECALESSPEPYRILRQRLAIKHGRLWLTTTPRGALWIRNEVKRPFEKGDPDYHVVKWRSIDNPVFDKKIYENAKKYEDPRWVAREYDAEDVDLGGVVFIPPFDEDEHTSNKFEYNPDLPVYWGMDPGIGTTYISYWQIDPEKGEEGHIYQIDELELHDYSTYQAMDLALSKPYKKPLFIACDPSGKYREKATGMSVHKVITDMGYGIPIMTKPDWNTHKMRQYGIDEMYRLLKIKGITFHSEKCWHMIRAFPIYCYPSPEEGKSNPKDNIPIKDGESDHRMESAFYFLMVRPRYAYKNSEQPQWKEYELGTGL